MAGPVLQPMGPCPCDPEAPCGVIGTKLSNKTAHLVGCECISCRNRRNQKKGKRGEYNAHRRVGGTGFTPHDELGKAYSIEVVQQVKKGRQVPRSLVAFVDSEWARHAWSQAERVIPAGVQAFAGIYCEPDGGGAFLVLKIAERPRRVSAL